MTGSLTKALQESKSQTSSLVPDVKLWRNAELDDVREIEGLINKVSQAFYGEQCLQNLIQFSVRSVVVLNVLEEIIAFVALRNYPPNLGVMPSDWPNWSVSFFKINELNPGNTLFIHYLVWKPRYQVHTLLPVFKDIFLSVSKLQYIAVVAPPFCDDDKYLGEYLLNIGFTHKLPAGFTKEHHAPTLYILGRPDVVNRIQIRKGVSEDNDDLVEILDATSPKLREIYGDFYIAELIMQKNSTRCVIVAEENSQVVGMMCLNKQVNIKRLNKNYELIPFRALRHQVAFSEVQDVVKISYIVRRASETYFKLQGFNLSEIEEMVEHKKQSQLLNVDPFDDEPKTPPDSIDEFIGQYNSTESIETIDLEINTSIEAQWEGLLPRFQTRQAYYNQETKELFETTAEENAFVIELFGLHESADERITYELLNAAFDCFYMKEYCLISFPTTSRIPLLIDYFMRVTPRLQCELNDSLYLAHKSTVTNQVQMRHAIRDDIDEIKKMILYGGSEQIPPGDDMMDIICESFEVTDKKVYDVLVMLSSRLLVGFIILEQAADVDILLYNYDLDRYNNFKIREIPDCHGYIVYAYASPILEPEATHIYREIHRLTGYTSLYYKLSGSIPKGKSHLNIYNTFLLTMFPVRPRRQIDFSDYDFSDVIEFSKETTMPIIARLDGPPFALFYQNAKLAEQKMKFIDTKIVIIGFGRTTQSFLETLIFDHKYKFVVFTNVTVIVSPGVFEADISESGKLDLLFQYRRIYNVDYLRKLELRTWVNFISGRMTKIDRIHKFVVIDGKERVKYDELYLFCGVQFDIPIEVSNIEAYPHNLVLMNKLIDAKIMYHKLCLIKTKFGSDFKIVVYGNSLKAYAGVHYLLTEGISGKNIYFVIPNIRANAEFQTSFADDDYIDTKMEAVLNKFKVNIYKDFKFVGWSLNDTGMITITTISFESYFRFLILPCTLFFCYNKKSVKVNTVKALNESGLVFDGRVVIDGKCRTNDSHIYAAGTFTKYKRALFAENFRHQYYDTTEIGKELAVNVINRWSGLTVEKNNSDMTNAYTLTVPQYKKPIVDKFMLPGGYCYLRVKTPGLQIPDYVARSLDSYGLELITGPPLEDAQSGRFDEKGYFRLTLDDDGFVTTIVCFAPFRFDPYKIVPIWGKHESLLNNLKANFERGNINDFFEFFRGRWMFAICHDRFCDLEDSNEKLIRSRRFVDSGICYIENLQKILTSKDEELSENERQILLKFYQRQDLPEDLRENLLKFLEDNRDTLFMYASRDELKEIK